MYWFESGCGVLVCVGVCVLVFVLCVYGVLCRCLSGVCVFVL